MDQSMDQNHRNFYKVAPKALTDANTRTAMNDNNDIFHTDNHQDSWDNSNDNDVNILTDIWMFYKVFC